MAMANNLETVLEQIEALPSNWWLSAYTLGCGINRGNRKGIDPTTDDLKALAAAYRQKDKDLKAARQELGKHVPTVDEMCGLAPDITDGLTMKEYMEKLSDGD